MQSIILERNGISYLEHNAIATVSRDETPVQCRYPRSDYSERPTAYVVTLNGSKRKRRVYATSIASFSLPFELSSNVSVVYLKINGQIVHCETALDHRLHN